MARGSFAGVNGGNVAGQGCLLSPVPLWLKRIFTTEDTEVHRDAQGKMKRTFYECGFGFLVVFGIVFGIPM